jgi:hypothetical protein
VTLFGVLSAIGCDEAELSLIAQLAPPPTKTPALTNAAVIMVMITNRINYLPYFDYQKNRVSRKPCITADS